MTELAQTPTSAPTGQAGAAGNTPATTGETDTSTTTETAVTVKGTLLGGEPAAEKKPEGTETTAASGENKTTPEAAADLDVKLPEGTEIDPAMLDGYKAIAKDLGLDSEKASKMATWYAEQQAVARKALEGQVQAQSDKWMQELKADKEIGGAQFPVSTAQARAAILRFGGPDAVAFFNHPAVGNHPVLFKMMANVGKAMAEDVSSVKAQPGGQVGLSEKEKLRLRYDKSQV